MRLFIQPFLNPGLLQTCAELHERDYSRMDEPLSKDGLIIYLDIIPPSMDLICPP